MIYFFEFKNLPFSPFYKHFLQAREKCAFKLKIKYIMVISSIWCIWFLGTIHKRRPQDFAKFWPPSSLVRRCLHWAYPLPPKRLASTSIRQNLHCIVNLLWDSGQIISHFLDEWEIFEAKNHQLQCIFILFGVMIPTVIEQLDTWILNQMWTSLLLDSPPNVCMRPFLLNPPPPTLADVFYGWLSVLGISLKLKKVME